MKTDVQIAQEAKMKDITEIAEHLNIDDEGLIFAYSSITSHNKNVLLEQVEVIINS